MIKVCTGIQIEGVYLYTILEFKMAAIFKTKL